MKLRMPKRYMIGLLLVAGILVYWYASAAPEKSTSCRPADTACGWTHTLLDSALGHWPMPRHMAVDPGGNLYLAGETYPEATRYVHNETLLAKYDPQGRRIWLRRLRAPGADGVNNAYGLAVDAAGNICLGGITDGSYADPPAPAGRKGFAARYDTHGKRLWAVDRPTEVFAMVQDGVGSCYAGSTNEVAKYDTRGVMVWSHRAPIRDIAVEPEGMLHLIGPEGSDAQPVLINLNALGKRVRRLPLELTQTIDWPQKKNNRFLLKVDGKGNVFIHASLSGTDSHGKTRVETYLAKVSSGGQLAWERHYGGEDERWDSFDFTVDRRGDVYLVGMRQNILAQGPRNAFVIKYSTDGELQWIRHFDGTSKNGAGSISIDAHGNYYIAGGTEGELEGQQVASGRRSTPFIARNRPAK